MSSREWEATFSNGDDDAGGATPEAPLERTLRPGSEGAVSDVNSALSGENGAAKKSAQAKKKAGVAGVDEPERQDGPPPQTPPNPSPVPHGEDGFDLTDPNLYLSRELTWINFNYRVLNEAVDPQNPLLERLKFVAIVGSNLDEFFMKRIGGLRQQVETGITGRGVDGRTPQEQIDACYASVSHLEGEQRSACESVLQALAGVGIQIRTFADLEKSKRKWLRDHYLNNIYPLVTPQATDPAHPFPFISNLSLNLLVTLRYPGDEHTSIARVKVPVGADIPRFVRVDDSEDWVPLESIMAHNLDILFPGMEVVACELFRVTRNAIYDLDADLADDLLESIETSLRKRRLAPIVRLQVEEGMDEQRRGMLGAELGLRPDDVFDGPGLLGLRDLMELVSAGRPDLRDPPHTPADHPALLTDRSIFHVIREEKSLLLHHPYQAFDTSVVPFLEEAARDPKVRAIKMTFYRTAPQSTIIDYLVQAARNGKQVAVVIELQARFDEEANIGWANALSANGIHVTYGVLGLKTHCKVILVVRQDHDGLRRYAHVGTGNYHSGTARMYCDHGLLTCDPQIGADLTELFNYLTTGYRPKRQYKKLLPAPKHLRPAILEKIEREIYLHSPDRPGLIQFQMNALEDAEVVRALYTAASKGVKVDLIVRDSCRIRPGIKGLSENIRVVSVVGRFLQHSRVMYFRNGGEDEYYIGSADCMRRNLSHRIEVMAPVEDPALREELRTSLDAHLNDVTDAWEMNSDGSYTQRRPETAEDEGAYQTLIQWAQKREFEATRLRNRRSAGVRGSTIVS